MSIFQICIITIIVIAVESSYVNKMETLCICVHSEHQVWAHSCEPIAAIERIIRVCCMRNAMWFLPLYFILLKLTDSSASSDSLHGNWNNSSMVVSYKYVNTERCGMFNFFLYYIYLLGILNKLIEVTSIFYNHWM